MDFINKRLLAVLLLAGGLTACSSTDDEEDKNKVAELTEITSRFEPKVLWEKSIGDGVDDFFSRMKPTTAYDRVFSGSRAGDAYAFDLKTGKEIWHVDLSDIEHQRGFFDRKKSAMIAGGPVAGSGKVFYASENGKVLALDAQTGAVVWQGNVKGEIVAAPALDAGVLVVNSVSGQLKAFNADDGAELWKMEQDVPPLTLRGISEPTIASGGVLIGTATGNVDVYILANGQQGWSSPVGETSGSTELDRVIDVDSAPIAYGDKVYTVSSRGNLAALDLRSGREVWKRQYSSYHNIAVTSHDIFLTDVKGHVYCIDRVNGLEKWSQLALTNRGVTGPAVVGDYVVVGDFEGYLHWLDQQTGDFVARHEVDSSGIHTTVTVADNVIYAQARNGDLQVIATP